MKLILFNNWKMSRTSLEELSKNHIFLSNLPSIERSIESLYVFLQFVLAT